MPAAFARLPGVVAPATVTLPRELLTSPDAAATLARHGFRFPAAGAHAGLSHGPPFCARRRAPATLAARRGRTAGRGADRHRVPRFPRRRRQGAQVSRDDDRRPTVSACTWRFQATGRSTTSPPRWRRRRTIAPRTPSFLENMPAVLGPRAMAALAANSSHAGPGLCGHRFRLEPRAAMCCSLKPMPRWW